MSSVTGRFLSERWDKVIAASIEKVLWRVDLFCIFVGAIIDILCSNVVKCYGSNDTIEEGWLFFLKQSMG